MNGELPEGWAFQTLADAGTWCSGGTPSRKNPSYFGGGIPWVKSGDLRDGLVSSVEETISRAGLEDSSAKLLPAGTVSVAMYGATIGRAGVLGIDAATNQACANCKPFDGLLDHWFLFYYLLSQREGFVGAGQGGAQPNISATILRDWPLPLAPLPEQRRIVDAVEALLEQVNHARERLDRVSFILKRFRQAVLAAACSGELTEDWRVRHPDQGSAARLLDDLFMQRRHEHERRLSNARGKGTRKPTTPRNLEPAQVPDSLPDLPNGWARVLFDDVCDDITVGHVGPMANEYVEHGIPFLRSQNVRPFRFDPRGLKFVTPAFHQRLAKSALKPGDIAVVRSGNAGEACVIPKELPDSNCADLVVMRPSHVLDSYFAAIFINSSAARAHIEDVKVGIAQGHYNIGSARETPVPLPPPAEQTEIVRQVDALFALADAIERRVQAATARADKLPQAILSKAFSGELVPTEADVARAEGRTYETAEELLVRVRADGENASGKMNRARRTRGPKRRAG